jgi:hypothetical protein
MNVSPEEPPSKPVGPNEIVMRRVELSAAPIGRLINIISLIAGLISVSVIGGVLFLAILDKPIPAELSNWGGIILGFYFGQFISIVKDYMGIVQSTGKE